MLPKETIRAQALQIRGWSENWLIDTCNIRYIVSTDVVNGEEIITWSSPLSTACRLIVRSGAPNSNTASQERTSALVSYTGVYRLQLPVSMVPYVDEGDRIEIGNRVFSIVFVPPITDITGAFIIGIREVT